eukprot:766272-Hanusia_phi.AAC.3
MRKRRVMNVTIVVKTSSRPLKCEPRRWLTNIHSGMPEVFCRVDMAATADRNGTASMGRAKHRRPLPMQKPSS